MRTRNAPRSSPPRRDDIAQVNFSIDREARALLMEYAGGGRESGGRAVGRFVTRLVFEHHARVQERQRALALLQGALEESTKAG